MLQEHPDRPLLGLAGADSMQAQGLGRSSQHVQITNAASCHMTMSHVTVPTLGVTKLATAAWCKRHAHVSGNGNGILASV